MDLPQLITADHLLRIGKDPRELGRLSRQGQLLRIRRGNYVVRSEWDSLNAAAKYGLRVEALARVTASPPVICGLTAARAWGLWTTNVPAKIHVVTESNAGGRSRNDVERRIGSLTEQVVHWGPVQITDKLRTTIELIDSLDFAHAVAVCDSSLHGADAMNGLPHNGFGPEVPHGGGDIQWNPGGPVGPALTVNELSEAADRLPGKARRFRAHSVISFSNELSGSAGESLSRANMHILGFPAPILQQHFALRDRSHAYVDFWFPEFNLVGEFDGREKYLRADWGRGANIQDRVLAEKHREDLIREQGPRVIRWTWQEMTDLQQFAAILRSAGLPQRR